MKATDPQKSYLARLANECFVKGLDVGYDMRAALRTMRRDEASAEINRLKQLLSDYVLTEARVFAKNEIITERPSPKR